MISFSSLRLRKKYTRIDKAANKTDREIRKQKSNCISLCAKGSKNKGNRDRIYLEGRRIVTWHQLILSKHYMFPMIFGFDI